MVPAHDDDDDDECGAVGGMICKGNRVNWFHSNPPSKKKKPSSITEVTKWYQPWMMMMSVEQ
jgi:hypothetical protein